MPAFAVKAQMPSVLDRCFDEFIIPSLRDTVDGDRDQMLLCHVRAIIQYLTMAEEYYLDCGNLFLPDVEKRSVGKQLPFGSEQLLITST